MTALAARLEKKRTLVERGGGRILVDALRIHAVDRVFCVPGESYLDVLDALLDVPQIEVIVAKHEGAAANMAEADGKLTGRAGICFVTRGPGATHASVGVHTAFQDSTPMILFVGQVERDVRGREAFQEIEFRQMFAPIAKWVAEIDDAARIPEYVLRAFQTATSGRPGPVVLSLPEDVLRESCAVADTEPFRAVKTMPNDSMVAEFRVLLEASERPLLILGGSNWTSAGCAAIASFASATGVPVVSSFRRQDLLDNRHPSYAGHMTLGMAPYLTDLVRSSDLLIAFGTRLGDIPTSGYTLLKPPVIDQRLIHIHSDPEELGRVFQADLAINAAPALFAEALSAVKWETNSAWTARRKQARLRFEQFSSLPDDDRAPDGVDLTAVVTYLSSHLPPDTIVSNGAGNYTVWVHRFFKYKESRTELAPTSGAMGYGFPAAIAAKLRHPSRISLCFAGDGCFLMYPQELATAQQYNAAAIVLVVNNGMYGTIRMHQERRFPGRVSSTNLLTPDFVALAKSFGAHAERVETTADFPAAFERAVDSARPALIELIVDPKQITPDRRLDR